jgi:hypothetical protein
MESDTPLHHVVDGIEVLVGLALTEEKFASLNCLVVMDTHHVVLTQQNGL